jgi:hypothetical protein
MKFALRDFAGSDRDVGGRYAGEHDQMAEQLAERTFLLTGKGIVRGRLLVGSWYLK